MPTRPSLVMRSPSQMRMDPSTRTWILCGAQPRERSRPPRVCPFCNFAPAQPILRVPEASGEAGVVVVPDEHPVFALEPGVGRAGDGMYDLMHSFGAHELIVETPRHGVAMSALGEDGLQAVLSAYRQRIEDLRRDTRFKHILIFKNHGRYSGSLIDHPHSHLIGTPVVPARLKRELGCAAQHFERTERCLFCDILSQERQQQVRIVEENEAFVVFCPFAPRAPYEVWVLPREHHFDFAEHLDPRGPGGGLLPVLAATLKRTLLRIEKVAPAYHYVLHTGPNLAVRQTFPQKYRTLREDFHWHLEILPCTEHVSRLVGDEEFHSSAIHPEFAAAELRAAVP